MNSGEKRLRQVDIHASERFVTEWLENWPERPLAVMEASASPPLPWYLSKVPE